MTFQISSQTLAEIFRHSATAFPREGCGFLLGRWDGLEPVIDEAVPAENTKASERDDYFEIDPLQYKKLEDSLRGSGRQILGFYHSHPNHPDVPSYTDLSFAKGWPGFLWMIVQVVDGVPVSQQTYSLSEDGENFQRLDCNLKRLPPPAEKTADYERMEREIAGASTRGAAGGPVVRRKVYLTFSQTLIQKPLVWELAQRFRIVTNIRHASVSGDTALVGLGLEGTAGEIDRGLAWLEAEGVRIEPIELGIVE